MLHVIRTEKAYRSFDHSLYYGYDQVGRMGDLIISETEAGALLYECPEVMPYLRKYVNSDSIYGEAFLQCIWLEDCKKSEINRLRPVKKRVQRQKKYLTRELDRAHRMPSSYATCVCLESYQPEAETNLLAIPYRYPKSLLSVPIRRYCKDTIMGDQVFAVIDGCYFEYGMICSQMHKAWADYLSAEVQENGEKIMVYEGIIYNAFPLPKVTKEQQQKIGEIGEQLCRFWDMVPSIKTVSGRTNTERTLSARLNAEVDKLYGDSFENDTQRVSCLIDLYQYKKSKIIS